MVTTRLVMELIIALYKQLLIASTESDSALIIEVY